MTKEPPTRADSVCASINEVGSFIEDFTHDIPSLLAEADETGSVFATVMTITAVLKCRLMQLDCIFQVHHDHLDRVGKTSALFKATEIQDEISSILDALDIYVAAEAS